MKLLALTLLLLFPLRETCAQLPRFSFGEEAATTHADLRLTSISKSENGKKIVLRSNFSNDATRYSVEVFDEGNNPIAFHPHKIIIPESDKLFYVETVVLNQNIFTFISHYQSAQKQFVLYAIPVTENGFHEDKKILLEKFPAFNPGNCGNYRINVSPSKKQIVLLHEPPSDKTKNESISVRVFDTELKESWRKDHVFEIPSRANPVNLPFINNKGDVFIIKKDRDKTQYKYLILAIDNSSHYLSSKPINVTSLMISDIKATLLESGQLAVFGFYSSQNYSDYEGMFYFAFDASGAVTAKHHERLSSEVLSLFMSKKEAGKDESSLKGFHLQHLIAQKSGGLYIVAEKNKMISENNNDFYLSEDILVLNLDPHGNLKWGNAIRKKQESYNDHGKWNSYNFWLHNDTLNILYNKVLPDDQLTKSGKKKKPDEFGENTVFGTSWIKVQPDGMSGINPLLQLHTGSSLPMSFNPELLYVSDKGYVYVICEDYLRKKHRLGELQFYK